MLGTENISTNPFLVVVLRGLTTEEPTIVPQSWLCDGNSFVAWPPSAAFKNTVCKKVTPGDNWLKYEVLQVYWKTATDNYQEANEYLQIAEDTSSEETIEQKFAELRDPKKRKYRQQRDLDTDDDSPQNRKIIRQVKIKNFEQGSVRETKNVAEPVELSKPLQELLINQNSNIPNKATAESTKSKPSNGNIEKNGDHKNMIIEDERDLVDQIDEASNNRPSTETIKGMQEPTASLEITVKTGSKPIAESEEKSKKSKPRVITDKMLGKNTIKVLPKKMPNTTEFVIENQETSGQSVVHNDNESAQNDSTGYARPGSSKEKGYSALKIEGANTFKPDEFVMLPMNEKLNVIGLQQQQIIANQAKLAVAMNTKKSDNETSTKESSLSFDETISMKAVLPVDDDDTFEAFDENVRNDTTFRGKVWQFLEPYISTTNWRETVRQMIRRVMCNEVQILYSCRGRKGKKPLNHTFFYELIEAATTKRPEKKYRAEQKQVLSYVSDYLKHAKTRLTASSNKEQGKGGKKKGSKSNPSKGKSLMGKKEKQHFYATLNNKVDSEDADDSS